MFQHEVKNIYIGEVTWWKPWSNTLAYFPLAEDWLDVMWNYTLSNTWTAQTIGRYFSDSSNLNTSISGVKTVSVWCKVISKSPSSTYGQMSILNWFYAGWFSFLIQSYNNSGCPQFYAYYNNVEYKAWNNLVNDWEWNLITIVFWDKVIWYVNWNSYTIYNGTLSNIGTAALVLKNNSICDLVLSNFIIESKARTAQEVSDYYNQTKANYWL